MDTKWIVIIISIAVCAALIAFMYFFAKRSEKKRNEQQAAIDQMKQSYNMLIIDKKKMRIKDATLPAAVMNEIPWFAKMTKAGIVKAKVGPKIMVLMADNDIYDLIPVKKEVKATVAGIYITDVRGIRGPLERPNKKKSFLSRLMGEK